MHHLNDDERNLLRHYAEREHVLPRRRVIRFWNGIADNLPAKKITGLAKCSCIGISKEHQIFRLQHNNVILLVASHRYLSPRRANKTINRY
jgi:hypothetical protein